LSLVNPTWAETDYQEVLLRFHTQQLVAHGAQLFAAAAATFMFITRLVEKTDTTRKRIGFVIFSGFLIGGTTFIGLRLMVYGALATGTVNFPIPAKTYYDAGLLLTNYTIDVNVFTFGEPFNTSAGIYLPRTYGSTGLRSWRHLLQRARISLDEQSPFNGFFVSLYVGYLIAYVILYAFGCHPPTLRASILAIFLALPPALGFVFAKGDLSLVGMMPDESLRTPVEWLVIDIWYVAGLFLHVLLHREQLKIRHDSSGNQAKSVKTRRNAQVRQERRELGWLILGIVIGGLLSLVVNLWTSYFLEWIKMTFEERDWTSALVSATIVACLLLGTLTYIAFRLLRASSDPDDPITGRRMQRGGELMPGRER